MTVETLTIPAQFPFPNSDYPVLLYRQVFSEQEATPEAFERLFAAKGWPQQWRNGVFTYQHFHSTAHETLGFYSGWAELQLGGPEGPTLTVRAGDAVLLPAGVAHLNIRQGDGFRCVGAYLAGADVDLLRGDPDEYEAAVDRSAAVPIPNQDPTTGESLGELWR